MYVLLSDYEIYRYDIYIHILYRDDVDEEEEEEKEEDYKPDKGVEWKLDLVVVDYETEYMKTKGDKKENKSISRGFSAQKQSFMDECIAKRIKMINEPITKVLDEYVFDVMNDKRLNGYRKEIIGYCHEGTMDKQTICQMKRCDFTKEILSNCMTEKHDTNELQKPLRDLYRIMGQYPEYLQLSTKLNANQQRLCCSCDCMHKRIEPSMYITDRVVLSDKTILTCSNDKGQDNEMQMQLMLNTTVMSEEEEDEDDYNAMVPKIEDTMIIYEDRIEFQSINGFCTH